MAAFGRQLPGMILLHRGDGRRLDRHALGFTGRDGVFRAEPGQFELWVCASSVSGEPVIFELLAARAGLASSGSAGRWPAPP